MDQLDRILLEAPFDSILEATGRALTGLLVASRNPNLPNAFMTLCDSQEEWLMQVRLSRDLTTAFASIDSDDLLAQDYFAPGADAWLEVLNWRKDVDEEDGSHTWWQTTKGTTEGLDILKLRLVLALLYVFPGFTDTDFEWILWSHTPPGRLAVSLQHPRSAERTAEFARWLESQSK